MGDAKNSPKMHGGKHRGKELTAAEKKEEERGEGEGRE